MTDNTASNPAPDPQHPPCPTPAPSPPASGVSGASQNWEVISFPGHLAITDPPESIPVAETSTAEISTDTAPPDTAAIDPAASTPHPPASAPLHRTEDLIQLIQDLNQCNDALLIRVSDLEESLERSQAALQGEIERNQAQGGIPDRTLMPPQIAQLLSELEGANDGLRRATIHNETLHTELESSQQRVAQLERECTLLQQRFSEKNTALQQAEDTCRDLKARLHRQQRYTLQFKTALEKCLNMANDAQPVPAMVASSALEEAQPVAMPSAPEIQPWTAPSVAAVQTDSLSNLLHSLKAPAAAPAPAIASVDDRDAAPAPFAPFNPVMADPGFSPVSDPWQPPAATDPSPGFTEPSPWGAPLMAPASSQRSALGEAPGADPVASAPPAAPETSSPSVAPETMDASVDPEPPVAAVQAAWAAPIAAAPPKPQKPTPSPTPAAHPQAHPQRPQRKIPSLAAVQLPSFGRPPRRSS